MPNIITEYKEYANQIPGYDFEKDAKELTLLLKNRWALLQSMYLEYVGNNQTKELMTFAKWLFVFKCDIIDAIGES